MRPILTGLLIFIFFYLISNMMVKHFNFGVLPSTVLLTLFGDEEQYIDPLSTASFLEFWHMEIFFIMMLLLTLSAVFIRIAKNSNLKIILINTLMLSSLVSLVSQDILTNKTLTSPVVNVTSDATGDVYYRNASGLFTRLPAGGTGTVLTIASGIPSWASPAGGGATVTHDYTIQASSYTGGNASGTTRSVFIRTIDTNNEGVFVKIKKNGTADTEVQIA